MIHETENPQEAKVSIRVSLRGMLMFIRVDTLRRVHYVGHSQPQNYVLPNDNPD